jgi:protein involved in polysaccharide export with SLBB domain
MKKLFRGKALQGAGGGAIIAQGAFTHAAGTIAAAGGTVYNITSGMAAVANGDFVTVAPVNYSFGTATVRGQVVGAGTVAYQIVNAAGTAIWVAGTVNYRIERP